MNATAAAAARTSIQKTAAQWITNHQELNQGLIAFLTASPNAMIEGDMMRRIATASAQVSVAYQVQMLLTHYGTNDDAAALSALVRTAVGGASQNQNTTSAGDRMIRQATTEAWLEIARTAVWA